MTLQSPNNQLVPIALSPRPAPVAAGSSPRRCGICGGPPSSSASMQRAQLYSKAGCSPWCSSSHSERLAGFVDPDAHPDDAVSQGDVIIAIDGRSISGVEPAKVLEQVAGPEHSTLVLEIQRLHSTTLGQNSSLDLRREMAWRPVAGAAAVRGLTNPDNSCFLNAPLQCIAHSFPGMVSCAGSTRPPLGNDPHLDALYNVAMQFADVSTAITTEHRPNNSAVNTTQLRRALA